MATGAPTLFNGPLYWTVNDKLLLTILIILHIILLERLFECSYREATVMVHSEMEVLNKIRNSNDPERSMKIATDIILDYLKNRESSPIKSTALPQAPCAIT